MDSTKAPGPGSITLGIAFISEENVMWPIYHTEICILHVSAADPGFLSNPDPYFYMSDLDPDALKVWIRSFRREGSSFRMSDLDLNIQIHIPFKIEITFQY